MLGLAAKMQSLLSGKVAESPNEGKLILNSLLLQLRRHSGRIE